MIRTASEIEKNIESACLLLNYFFSKNFMDKDMSVWIYPGNESDILEICLQNLERYRKERKRNRVLIISTEDIENSGDTDLISEKVTEEQMNCLLDWYTICHPTAWIYVVISLEKPYGREGKKWMDCYNRITKEMACVTGILNLAYEDNYDL